jgi:hypothetical protein
MSFDALTLGVTDIESRIGGQAPQGNWLLGGELRGGLGLADKGSITPERLRWLIWATPVRHGTGRLFVLDALDGSVAEARQRRSLGDA